MCIAEQIPLSPFHLFRPRPRAVHQVVIGLEAPFFTGQGVIDGQKCLAATPHSLDALDERAAFDMRPKKVANVFEPFNPFFAIKNGKRLTSLQHQRQFEIRMDQIASLVDPMRPCQHDLAVPFGQQEIGCRGKREQFLLVGIEGVCCQICEFRNQNGCNDRRVGFKAHFVDRASRLRRQEF